MNNAMGLAINRIMFSIPSEILTDTFRPREPFEATLPLDMMIIEKVIRLRVLKDCNVFGGKTTKVVLRPEYMEKLKFDHSDDYTRTGPFSLYRVPPEEREGCPIVDIHHLTYAGNYAGHYPNATGWQGGTNVPALGQAVLDSHTFASTPPRPLAQLLSGDLVKLTPSQHAAVNWVMECRISYDENVTNMATSSMETFCNLCVAAVKSYIYNTNIIRINRGYVESGYVLDEWKTIIDSYSDQEQRYLELLTLMSGASVLSPDRLMTIMKYII